jgi:ribonucleotide reductase beta subunit family protein with ferritin-like domain
MIFGVPLSISDLPNLVTVFDIKSKYLYFHPMNAERSIDLNAPLTCTYLRFNRDYLTENLGIEREYKIIEKIKNVESSIIDFTGYDVLHPEFSLQ